MFDRIFCLSRGSVVAINQGDVQLGVSRMLDAQRLLKDAPFQSDILQLSVLMDLAEAYRTAARYGDAIPVFEQAATRLSALGRDDTEAAGTLLNNWALTLDVAGRPREAEPVFRRAISISRADSSDHGVSPMLLTNYARVLRELGRLDEAADYAERAYAGAAQAGDQSVVAQALMQRATVYRERHELARAAAMLQELEPRWRAMLPPGHIAFAALTSAQSQLAEASGDLTQAQRLANEALTIAEGAAKAGRQGREYVPLMLDRRALVELERGDARSAAADAQRAVEGFRALISNASPSAFLGHASLTLGRVYLALGQAGEARTALAEAAAQLSRSVGDHADLRLAKSLLPAR